MVGSKAQVYQWFRLSSPLPEITNIQNIFFFLDSVIPYSYPKCVLKTLKHGVDAGKIIINIWYIRNLWVDDTEKWLYVLS